MGYDTFQLINNIHQIQKDDFWQSVKFHVFDIVSNDTYENRLKQLQAIQYLYATENAIPILAVLYKSNSFIITRGQLPPHVKILEMTKCKDRSHLLQYLDEVVARGGEGVVIRQPTSLYLLIR